MTSKKIINIEKKIEAITDRLYTGRNVEYDLKLKQFDRLEEEHKRRTGKYYFVQEERREK